MQRRLRAVEYLPEVRSLSRPDLPDFPRSIYPQALFRHCPDVPREAFMNTRRRTVLLVFAMAAFCAPLFAQASRPVYLYVAGRNQANQGLLSVYQVDLTTGALSPVSGSPFLAGTDPYFVVVDPPGRFVYVANADSNNISAYQVDANTGSLTELPGSPFLAGRYPGLLRIDPTGRYLYAGNGLSMDLSAFSIDSVTGVLTPIAGSPFLSGTSFASITFDPSGNHAYFGESRAPLAVDSMNLQDGTFAPVQSVPDDNVYSTAFSPNGKFAFTADLGDAVRAYFVDAATGALTALPGSPYSTGPVSISAAMDNTGKFLYVANENNSYQATNPPSEYDGTISGFVMDPLSGALTPMPSSPFPADINTSYIAVSPVGQFAYALARIAPNSSGGLNSPGVVGFSIDPNTGVLTPLPTSPSTLTGPSDVQNIAISLGPSGLSNPFPMLSSISPSSIAADAAGFTLQVNGANFVQASTVYFGGQARPTTFVSSTQLNAGILSNDVVTGGTAVVSVFNPLPGGGFSSSVEFSVSNPSPTLSSITPSTVVAGGAAGTLTVNGTNFVSTSVVNFNGLARSTTYVSATQLTIAFTAVDIANQGSASITVTNPSSGIAGAGGTSSALALTILSASVQPTIGILSPASVTAGAPAFTLSIVGSGFTATSLVSFNLSNVVTTYISATQLQASIPASAVAHAGFPVVEVTNPGLGVSLVVTFTVNSPPPSGGTVTPSTLPAGNAALTLNVTGTNFTPDSVVLVNGSARVTTYVSPTLLQATLLASDLSKGGTLNITVSNPSLPNGTGGGTTGALALNVSDYTVTPPATMKLIW